MPEGDNPGGSRSTGREAASAKQDRVTRPFAEERHTALWRAVDATLAELVATREITINTAPDYVVGYLCRELTAKRVVSAEGSDKSDRR